MRYLIVCLLALASVACSSSPDEPVRAENVESLNDVNDWAEDLPDCADVWIEGRTLPEDYEGCKDGDTAVAAVSVPCGEVDIYTHEPDDDSGFFTDKDGRIHDAGPNYANERMYKKLYASCD